MSTSYRAIVIAACLSVMCGCENPVVEAADDGGLGPDAESVDAGELARDPTDAAVDAVVQRIGPRLRGTRCTEGSAGCDGSLAGTYAVAMDLDVYWHDRQSPVAPAFDPGRGGIRIVWMSKLSDMCPGGTPGESLARVCGIEFPAVHADHAGSVMQLIVPDAAWERASMPVFTAMAQPTAGEVLIERVTSAFGLALSDGEGAAWPSAEEAPFVECGEGRVGSECFLDQDADGAPGISIEVRPRGEAPGPGYGRVGGWHFAPAPHHANAAYVASGATELYGALRIALGGVHPLGEACHGGSGPAIASEVELRVWDCRLDDGSPCSGASAAYVDRNMPVFRALRDGDAPPSDWKHQRPDADRKLERRTSPGPRNTVVRLGDVELPASCADVREVFAGR